MSPGAQADIAIIETNDPEALLAQARHHLIRPVDQLTTEPHDQQQGRITGPTDTLISKLHLAQIDPFGRHPDIAALGGQRRDAAQQGEEEN